MKTNIKTKIIFTLISTLVCNTILPTYNTHKNDFWGKVGIAAAAVAASVGACKLASWYFYETNEELIKRAEQEYQKSFQFIDSVQMIESAYKLDRIRIYETWPLKYGFDLITSQDRHLIFDTLYEPALYSLARFWFDRGITSRSYIHEIVAMQQTLHSTAKTLSTRIDEKKGVYVDYKEAQQLKEMKRIAHYITNYLSHLTLLADYVTHHKSYFIVFDEEAYAMKKYDTELRILNSGTNPHIMINDLKQTILWNYSGQKYPFVRFVSVITDDIHDLQRSIRSAAYNYAERLHYARLILESLDWIKKAIASDERYVYELHQQELERLERARVEALQEKARMEKALVDAQREQNRLLAQNNILQTQQLINHMYDERSAAPNVMIVVQK